MTPMQLAEKITEWLNKEIYPKATKASTRQMIRMAGCGAGKRILAKYIAGHVCFVMMPDGTIDMAALKELALAALDGDDFQPLNMISINKADAEKFFAGF